jgi:glycosyltransferase involved in cell wall biosynthesis
MKSIAVVTATTGRDSLLQTIESVKKQSYPCNHYIFVDGQHELPPYDDYKNIVVLPKPTGLNGMMNGGIVAASAYLVTEDYICWLDDDNWFDSDHVESLVEAIEDKPYAYSLRKLIEPDGTFWANDDCESLGHHADLIDLNCYLMKRDLATGLAPCWYQTTGELMIGDRYVWAMLKQNNIPYGASGKYTVNYRLNSNRDLKPMFFQGNIKNIAKYQNKLPWSKA